MNENITRHTMKAVTLSQCVIFLCHTSLDGSSDIVAGCSILCHTSLDGREVPIYGTTTRVCQFFFSHSSEILRSVEW